MRIEFTAHSADEAIATMVDNPHINQVPVLIGGNGKQGLYEFYANSFLPQLPPDMERSGVPEVAIHLLKF
jgi:carboxymethylenebutenolidase